MTTLNQNKAAEKKSNLVFVNFSNTKRSQWGNYRRYTC